MGLDFSHADAHWSYSGFNRFRRRVAAAVGIELDRMEGYHRSHQLMAQFDRYLVDGTISAPETPVEAIPWSIISSPLVALLDHSDCDGELSPEECATIAPALEAICLAWEEDDFDRQQGLLLVEGLRECAESGEAMEFC
jgi:hypothetical protein